MLELNSFVKDKKVKAAKGKFKRRKEENLNLILWILM